MSLRAKAPIFSKFFFEDPCEDTFLCSIAVSVVLHENQHAQPQVGPAEAMLVVEDSRNVEEEEQVRHARSGESARSPGC